MVDLNELACVSSAAAIALDNLYLGRDADYSSIERLSLSLREYHKGAVSDDPTMTRVLYDTLKQFSNREIKEADDFMMKTSLLLMEISNSRTLPKERLALLRDYCVELSRASMTYAEDYKKYLVA